jgi:hypothetical protein
MPELPYAGTSGYSGTDTSEARARKQDADGTTTKRQKEALMFLWMQHENGCTWKEFAEAFGVHHGSASGVLSVLHLAGKIERLALTRNRCKIYVIPEYVAGRETEKHGSNKNVAHKCWNCGVDV